MAKTGNRHTGTRVAETERRHNANAKQRLNIDRRAKWVLREWERCPSYSYSEMIAAIRERFQIGETMAEVAYARARELFAEGMQKLDMSKLAAEYWKLYELAVTDKKYQAAVRILNSMGVATGVVVPRARLDVNGNVHSTVNVTHTAHIAALQLTPIQRRHREQELLTRGGMQALPAEAVDDMIANAIDAVSSPVEAEVVDDEGFDVP